MQANNWLRYSKTKPLMYVRYCFQITIYMIFTNIIMISIMEWASMYYIVKSQEGRSIGEIMFDHQQENMESDISSKGSVESRFKNQKLANYRKKEVRNRKRYVCYLVTMNIVGLLFQISSYLSLDIVESEFFKPTKIAIFIYEIILMFNMLRVFIKLYLKMKNSHRYEYETTGRSMVLQFTVSLMAMMMVMIYSTTSLVSTIVIKGSGFSDLENKIRNLSCL